MERARVGAKVAHSPGPATGDHYALPTVAAGALSNTMGQIALVHLHILASMYDPITPSWWSRKFGAGQALPTGPPAHCPSGPVGVRVEGKVPDPMRLGFGPPMRADALDHRLDLRSRAFRRLWSVAKWPARPWSLAPVFEGVLKDAIAIIDRAFVISQLTGRVDGQLAN